MLINAIKNKSLKSKFKRLYSKNRTNNLLDNINTVVFLVDKEEDVFEINHFLEKKLEAKEIIPVLVSSSAYKTESHQNLLAFSLNDFTIFGRLKSNNKKELVKRDLDLLINYTTGHNFIANVLTLKFLSKFKIGFRGVHENLFDFSVIAEEQDVNILNQQMLKYINIINQR